jgi:hypothetical protein
MPRSAALAAILFALAALPATAGAATYTQYACQLPNGTPIVADGFVGYALGTSSTYGDGCLAGGRLFASVPGSSSGPTAAGQQYHAPADTKIVGVRVTRDTQDIGQPGTASYVFEDTADRCVPDSGCPNGISGGTFSWQGEVSALDFIVQCRDSGCTAPGPRPTINLRRLEIDLNDAAVPQITAPPSTGLFDTKRSLHGTEAVAYTATDAGGGVSSASLVIDGVERDRRVPDANHGNCRTPYTRRTPCAPSVDAAYGFDTTQLPDGRHDVTLLVRDATEVNQATYGPVPITVDNRPASPASGASPGPGDVAAFGLGSDTAGAASPRLTAPNGTGATTSARLAGAHGTRTIRYGSTTVLRGTLDDGHGAAIAHARLDVLAALRMPGAKRAVVGHVTTTATGAFAYRLPAGAGRDVTIGYRAHLGDAAYAATRKVTVLVRAGVRLSRSRAALRNGGLLTLTARVLGAHVRRRATTVAFQVQVGSRWRTFGATSIDARGRALVRHRFRYTTRTTGYRFRARTLRAAAFPYVAGTSSVARVVVRP